MLGANLLSRTHAGVGRVLMAAGLTTACGSAAETDERRVQALEVDGVVLGTLPAASVDTEHVSGRRQATVAMEVDGRSGPALVEWVRREADTTAPQQAGRGDVALVELDTRGAVVHRVDLGKALVDHVRITGARADGSVPLALVVRMQAPRHSVQPAEGAGTAEREQMVSRRLSAQELLDPGFTLEVEVPGRAQSAITCGALRDPVCRTLSFTLSLARLPAPDAASKDLVGGTLAGAWLPGQVTITRDWTGDTTLADWFDQAPDTPRRVTLRAGHGAQPLLTLDIPDGVATAWDGPERTAYSWNAHAVSQETLMLSYGTLLLQ